MAAATKKRCMVNRAVADERPSKQPTPKYPTDLVLDFLEGGNSDANFGRG